MRFSFSWRAVYFLIAFGLMLAPTATKADIISYEFSGHLTYYNDFPDRRIHPVRNELVPHPYFQDNVSVGNYFHGTFTYNTEAFTSGSWVDNANISIRIANNTGGEYPFSFSIGVQGYVANNTPSDLFGRFGNGSPLDSFVLARLYTGGDTLNEYGVFFGDSTGTALSSAEAPSTLPGLANWDSPYFYWERQILTGFDPGQHRIIGQIENLSPVPEPATMLLLGSGLAGLIGFRRRFRK